WESKNSLVMSWLINSMQAHITHSFLLLDSANKIWSAAAPTYSQTSNDVRVYDLKKRVHETKQGEMTVAQYFAKLNTLWQELDFYEDFQPECPVDTTRFQKWIEKERVLDFLARLTLEYDQTKSHILGRDPFPSLRQLEKGFELVLNILYLILFHMIHLTHPIKLLFLRCLLFLFLKLEGGIC
ncbi:UBN2_3 domain-containing protein, partial [Cephalotus follicularis]